MHTLQSPYRETRRHELRKSRMLMVDGNLIVNQRTSEGGLSSRVYEGGYWGFASAPGGSADSLEQQARRNAQAMARFGRRSAHPLPGGAYRGEHRYAGKPLLTPGECIDRLAALHAHCKRQFPGLKSTRFALLEEEHSKRLSTSIGGESLASIQRALCYLTLIGEDTQGTPIEVFEPLSSKGSLAEIDFSVEALAPLLDRMHEHLQAKRHAVTAEGGLHTVVMAPKLAGMLAHEAMGHPCEADIVLGGAVTGDLLGQRVASDLVTMIDYAHTFDGAEARVPVYVDDEGTPARDAVLIERGILRGFMSSRETAARLGIEPSGSARAFGPNDEPLVRMRNTAILPGTDKYQEMIAGVERGYLLMSTSNGQADSTTEFMFGINLGYEIRDGKLGRAIRDTTLSGSAIKVLQSVDAVSDDMVWDCSGYCGKKQTMVVSMGGPALRAQAHLGGE
ncbi:TldD/PmbA family protein [Aquincola sp. S2]|uniref:TldD/PmbA family protein n=1 Tax=Pseudaquabacterium terrae TaxID=2732868 RepID=A0ABX2EFP9_9BURK|nr:TldD/PmbA family protein [Aquabacterium terrae]NRF67433.1 TldD/PmbA family protein [Aquabacterium terrae]